MFAKKFAKGLCAALVAAVMLLSVLLTMAFNMGLMENSEDVEANRFRPSMYNRPANFELEDYMKDDIPPVNAPILQIVSTQSERELYLKTKSYGDYLGVGFDDELEKYEYKETFTEVERSSGQKAEFSANYLPEYTTARTVKRTLVISGVNGIAPIRVIPYYLRPSKTLEEMQMSDMQATGSTKGESYTMFYTSETVAPLSSEYISNEVVKFESNYRDHVYNTYLKVDDGSKLGAETASVMNEIVKSLKLDGMTQKDKVKTIAKYVKEIKEYSLTYDTALDKEENRAVAFLTNDKYTQGLCEHYAEVGTLLFRAAGIPARYTEGIYLQNIEAQTYKQATPMDMHAWVEIYTDGIGWEQVEVTPPRQEEDSDNIATILTTLSGNVFLKQTSKGNYNAVSGEWGDAAPYGEKIFDIFSADYLYGFLSENAKSELHVVKITPQSFGMYFAPYYMTYDPEFLSDLTNGVATGDNFIQTDDTVMDGDMDGYTMNVTPTTVNTWVSSAYMRDLVAFEIDYRDYVYERYMESATGDAETDMAIDSLLEKLKKEAGLEEIQNTSSLTAEEKTSLLVEAIYEYMLEKGVYTVSEKPDSLKAFLTADSLKGDSSQYASAVTLMLRRMGIPARYTEGAYADGIEANRKELLTKKDLYSWVEVYIDGYGWKYFDVSPERGVHINLILTPKSYREQLNDYNDGIYEEDIPIDGFTAVVREDRYKQQLDKYEITNVVIAPKEEGGFKTPGKGYSYIKQAQVYRNDGVLVSEVKDGEIINYFANEELTLQCAEGILQLYYAQLKYSSNNLEQSYTKPYDGMPYTGYKDDIKLVEDESDYFDMSLYTVEFIETQTSSNEGVKAASFDIKIYNSNGEDCTEFFYLEKEYGQIVIQGVGITITAATVQRAPGEPLTAEEYQQYTVEGAENLSEGHYIDTVLFEESLVGMESGIEPNVITSVVIRDKNNIVGTDDNGENIYADVTNNYNINLVEGQIILLPEDMWESEL